MIIVGVGVSDGWFKQPYLADWLESGARWGCTPFTHWVICLHRLNQPSKHTLQFFDSMATQNTRPCYHFQINLTINRSFNNHHHHASNCLVEPNRSHLCVEWQPPVTVELVTIIYMIHIALRGGAIPPVNVCWWEAMYTDRGWHRYNGTMQEHSPAKDMTPYKTIVFFVLRKL